MNGPHIFAPPPDRAALLSTAEHEQCIVGSLLANNRLVDLVSDLLRPEHFSDALAGRVYADVLRVTAKGGVASVVTLRAAYEAEGILAEVGGPAYLAGLLAMLRPKSDLRFFAQQIVDRWRRRRAVEIAEELVRSATERLDEEAGPEILGEAAAALAGTADAGGSAGGAMFGDALDRTLRAMEAEAAELDRPLGLSTGIGALDDLLQGGLHPGQLVVIGGRPGHGKTTLALQIALRAARDGAGTAFFSLEMQEDEMVRRSLAHLVNNHRLALRLRNRSAEDWNALAQARSEFAALPLHIDDRKRPTVGQIGLRLRAIQRRMKLGLVVVDYLGLMAPPLGMERANQSAQLEATTSTLKAMAGDLGVPIVLAAQLNRGVEAREDKRPTASDFRGSGGVEQDADVALLVVRDELYLREREPQRREGEGEEKIVGRLAAWRDALARARGVIEIGVPKFRQGATGVIRARYEPGTFRITDAEGRP